MKYTSSETHDDGKRKQSAVKPINSAICLILLAQLIAPICDAQETLYKKLRRGQPCPYDSCVATELTQWRRESLFISTLQSENKSMRLETESMQSEINLADSLSETYRAELLIMEYTIARKDSINKILSTNLNAIHGIASEALRPKRWHEKPGVWFGLGIITSFLISR